MSRRPPSEQPAVELPKVLYKSRLGRVHDPLCHYVDANSAPAPYVYQRPDPIDDWVMVSGDDVERYLSAFAAGQRPYGTKRRETDGYELTVVLAKDYCRTCLGPVVDALGKQRPGKRADKN